LALHHHHRHHNHNHNYHYRHFGRASFMEVIVTFKYPGSLRPGCDLSIHPLKSSFGSLLAPGANYPLGSSLGSLLALGAIFAYSLLTQGTGCNLFIHHLWGPLLEPPLEFLTPVYFTMNLTTYATPGSLPSAGLARSATVGPPVGSPLICRDSSIKALLAPPLADAVSI
jgi:hypothetical protein